MQISHKSDLELKEAGVLYILWGDKKIIPFPHSPTHLAIGVFDGVHLGHQALLQALAMKAKGTVLTFSTHPRSFPLLCTLEHRIKLIEPFGHNVVPVTFESIKGITAKEFLDQLIAQGLKQFILGYDNHIGKGRAGTPNFIKQYLEQRSVEVIEVPPVLEEGEPISSGRIRKLIESGDLANATSMLGRPYSLFISTHNFSLEGLVTPPFGTYAALLKTTSGIFKGTATIGKPEKETATPLLEVHLFDLDQLPPPPYEVVLTTLLK